MDSSAFLYAGGFGLLVGLVGTIVSTYYVATSKKNDRNYTTKIVFLSISIVIFLLGGAGMFYHYYGRPTCPLEAIANEAIAQGMTPPPPPTTQTNGPQNINVHINPVPPRV